LPYTGTRPALTMSVPVRYSAAAEYAVVDSGLDNTLTQEEQYHRQQQQQYQQQQQHCLLLLLSLNPSVVASLVYVCFCVCTCAYY